jgi:NADPH2:quinone reductase
MFNDLELRVPNSSSRYSLKLTMPFQALTAPYLVSEYREIRPGDRVLVHAAADGVGQLLVQWLKHLGAWVVGTVSTDAKASIVRAAGADAVIDYGRDYAFLDELRSLTDGRGIDLAFDGVGARTLANTLKGLARGGTVVSFGSASGPPPSIHWSWSTRAPAWPEARSSATSLTQPNSVDGQPP